MHVIARDFDPLSPTKVPKEELILANVYRGPKIEG